ncbi:acetyltransferase domain protein [Rhodococcus sp. MTM3W5.2]|uniref:GNAT family N-acetyltransferase n=1 Tax=Rhodococcus sp. MTM3W5.2 TaxID=1805827 RepID=UPI0009790F39|nr:GNAT family N-acetyltransferase [Rhodococcus sp. MTM3W5.2]AQA20857.1 acetyltransferase domain protein [Rhodococcus sp. MTM3W5.2]
MPNQFAVIRATASDAGALAALATQTFPLACPPTATETEVADFVATMLSEARFTEYLAAPDRTVLKAIGADGIIGYSMLIDGTPEDPDVLAAVTLLPTLEISKLYVLPDRHGDGVAAALMTAALDHARALGAAGVWLGVNQVNTRAQRFYAKHGFERVGTKTNLVGGQLHHDFVMQRAV